MPQAIARPVWKMIWTTALKTGPWSNKPCMGPTSLCIQFLEPKRGAGPGPRKMGPGWTRAGPGGTRVGSLRVLFFLRSIEEYWGRGSLRVPAGPLRVPCFPGKMHVRVPAGPRSCRFYTTPSLGYTMLIKGRCVTHGVDQAEWKLFH